ncbi:protein of unknown function [Magnetospirillum gryphiswaldense MSR-1 v2]|uniref:Response regulatory domain-containing protein n=1 Tax=Magnetospirillum gryphiswaldense (strain DSM 6361 / JCM 21280 / NBRC 15271 / MSR-1) TaxID=431944 RepID=V6F6U6_MAGGM|nr:response regulator [Magnetospirillum gryphiswaldense]CDL01240.1 protein of unknown function [Magnetospirillum gryphiswaldense MSR-1 v2]
MRVICAADAHVPHDVLALLSLLGIPVERSYFAATSDGLGDIGRGDIMLLDLRRHPRQAIDTIKSIRRRQGFGPGIIVMTRRGDVVITLEALEAGADSLTHCPGTDATLVAASIIGLGRLMGVLPQGVRVHRGVCQTGSGCGAIP